MRIAIVVVITAFACGCAENTLETIQRAEKTIPMPTSSYPLSWYDRYYAIENGKAVGIFITNDAHKGKAALVASERELPYRTDGGCSVIRTELELKTLSWRKPVCHG